MKRFDVRVMRGVYIGICRGFRGLKGLGLPSKGIEGLCGGGGGLYIGV